MSNYYPLARLIIKHNYFSDGLCSGLSFSPTAEANKLMSQYNLIIRSEASGFSLYADVDCTNVISEEIILRFIAFTRDPYFVLYTDECGSSPLFYTTQHVDGTNQLLYSDFCTPDDLNEPTLRPAIKTQIRTAFICDIHISGEMLSNRGSDNEYNFKPFIIQFTARAIPWKYYFFGELAKYDLEIKDIGAESCIAFTPYMLPVVKNSKAFISETPIIMSANPKQKFQLHCKGNPGKVFIKRLPNATLRLLGKEKYPNGQHSIVAEIFIN